MTTFLPDLVEQLLAGPHPLPIAAAGDPVLRVPAARYDGQLTSEQLSRLISAMRDTMYAAPGVGLAAPQIGIPLRLAVVEDRADVPPEVRAARERFPLPFRVLINPEYHAVGEARSAFFEGCLSVPGWAAVVARPTTVRVRGANEHGESFDEEVSGWTARILQHETDHLDGTLYLDRAITRSLTSAENFTEHWNQPTPENAARALRFDISTS
ncbi:peptide deformylase [Nocardia jejuensis]|uniref:peptide deformylase n=1 Tax=Nocardia jejuensis TaxID=328049 RepID=UPI00082BB14B|nr:peptide deformylase [Nocardia jejuensis]